MDAAVVRDQLVELLQGEHAHVGVERALAGLPPRLRAASPGKGLHSVWDLFEHIRLAQEDILRYTLDPGWKSPEWPKGYWPAAADAVDDARWEASLQRFRSDLEEVCALARDPKRELTARIPHGEGRSYLRQVLLVADHNAYHAGQIVEARKALGAWT